MKYRLLRNRPLAFQNFQASLKRAAAQLPELVSSEVPHYSKWYEASSMQDLINQFEFDGEAEGDDQVLDEQGTVVGKIEEELCLPLLVCVDGSTWLGRELTAAGDSSELLSDDYAKKLVNMTMKKEN